MLSTVDSGHFLVRQLHSPVKFALRAFIDIDFLESHYSVQENKFSAAGSTLIFMNMGQSPKHVHSIVSLTLMIGLHW